MRKDFVSTELREEILKRDKYCFGLRYDASHKCFTRFRKPHPAWATNLLEIEHFHHGGTAMMGKRAESGPANCVALCGLLNFDGPSADMRRAMRDYVNQFYGEENGNDD